MPGGSDTVRCGIRETYDGKGTFVPGAAEGKGPMQVVQGGDGTWFASGAHAYSALEGSREEVGLVSHGIWQGTVDVPYGIPNLWWSA